MVKRGFDLLRNFRCYIFHLNRGPCDLEVWNARARLKQPERCYTILQSPGFRQKAMNIKPRNTRNTRKTGKMQRIFFNIPYLSAYSACSAVYAPASPSLESVDFLRVWQVSSAYSAYSAYSVVYAPASPWLDSVDFLRTQRCGRFRRRIPRIPRFTPPGAFRWTRLIFGGPAVC